MSLLQNCDMCGRFVLPGSPGTSWVCVPTTDVNYGDERDRCARCTEKHGPALCSPNYRRDLCTVGAIDTFGTGEPFNVDSA